MKKVLTTFYLIILYLVSFFWFFIILGPVSLYFYSDFIDYSLPMDFKINVTLWHKILIAALIIGVDSIITLFYFLSIKYAKKLLFIKGIKLNIKYLMLSLTMFTIALVIMFYVFIWISIWI